MSQSENEEATNTCNIDINGNIVWAISSTAAGQAGGEFQEGIMYPELPRVTCEELKQLMDEGVDLTLVDTGGGGHFRMEHIKGASNIPSDPLPPYTEEWVENKLTMLPSDKLTIFYCDWEDDSGSASLALKLIQTGFDAGKVKVLSKGWNRWMELGYPIDN